MGLIAALWEGYKLVGPQDGGTVFGWKLLPRAKDRVMPHVSDILSRFGDPINRSSDETVLSVVLKGVWFSLRLVLAGFGMGLVLGVLLAVVMCRVRMAERAVLPYLVISQTVPLIALAPLVVSWGGKLQFFGWEWPRWLSASVLGAFLTVALVLQVLASKPKPTAPMVGGVLAALLALLAVAAGALLNIGDTAHHHIVSLEKPRLPFAYDTDGRPSAADAPPLPPDRDDDVERYWSGTARGVATGANAQIQPRYSKSRSVSCTAGTSGMLGTNQPSLISFFSDGAA